MSNQFFNRLTGNARSVVLEAQRNSRGKRTTSADLLYGVVICFHPRALESLIPSDTQATTEDKTTSLLALIESPGEPPGGKVPFGRGAKRVLADAVRHAKPDGADFVNCAHLLLAVLSTPNGDIVDNRGSRAWRSAIGPPEDTLAAIASIAERLGPFPSAAVPVPFSILARADAASRNAGNLGWVGHVRLGEEEGRTWYIDIDTHTLRIGHTDPASN